MVVRVGCKCVRVLDEMHQTGDGCPLYKSLYTSLYSSSSYSSFFCSLSFSTASQSKL